MMVILAILAAIAIPTFLTQRSKGELAQAKTDARSLALAMISYQTEKAHFTDDEAELGFRRSSDVTAVRIEMYKSAPRVTTTVPTEATKGFCVEVETRSGGLVVWDSVDGGLKAEATCP